MDMTLEGARRLRGEIFVPGDKSISHRALMLGGIARGVSAFSGLSSAQDVSSTAGAVQALGVKIIDEGRRTVVEGKGLDGFETLRKESPVNVECGNSGTTARLLIGLLSGAGLKAVLMGDASLSSRPMQRVIEPLSGCGACLRSNGGFLPVETCGGRLSPFEHTLRVPSAQVKSALLIAALFINGTSVIREPVFTRDHTERMLRLMKADIQARAFAKGQEIAVSGRSELSPLNLIIPGDISSAAFFIACALTLPGSDITIRNVLLNPTRSRILDVLKRMGGKVEAEVEGDFPEPYGAVRVKSSNLHGAAVSGDEVPFLIDEIPALASAAFLAEGDTVVRDAAELRVKESDRIRAIVDMVRRFGGQIEELDDGFIIHGGKKLPEPSEIDSFGDHRIAMAAAVLALQAHGATTLKDAHCVDISFPGFFETLQGLASS